MIKVDQVIARQRLETSFYTLDIASEVEQHTSVRLSCPDSKKQYNGACPYPNCSADTNGFIVWPELTERGCHYYCRQCGKKGDILKLIMDIKGLNFGDACKELGIPNPYREDGDDTPNTSVKRMPKVEQWQMDELQYLNSIYPRTKLALQRDRARAYLAERGISFELAVEHGLGYIPALSEVEHVSSEIERFRRWCDRIIFPIYTPKGEIGYCGRSLFLWEVGMDEDEHKNRIDAYNLQMKELHSEKAPWHQMPRWKYTYQHAFFNLQAAKEANCPVFVEGPFDVLACLASGIQGVVSIGTNKVDVRILPANVYSAIMALDIDGPGRKAAKELAKGLRRKGLDVATCHPVNAKDWSAAYRIQGVQGLVPIREALAENEECCMCHIGGIASMESFESYQGKLYCRRCLHRVKPPINAGKSRSVDQSISIVANDNMSVKSSKRLLDSSRVIEIVQNLQSCQIRLEASRDELHVFAPFDLSARMHSFIREYESTILVWLRTKEQPATEHYPTEKSHSDTEEPPIRANRKILTPEQWEASNALQFQRQKEYHEKWRSHGYPVPESIIGPDGFMVVPTPR